MSDMEFALSSRWNARRHKDGKAMVEEILGLGFHRIELGYDFRRDLVPGVLQAVKERAVTVVSVHNYCPVPMGVPRGHPELWTLADPDAYVRKKAVEQTAQTVRFAAEVGAGAVIVHGGNVRMRPLTRRLIALTERDRSGGWWWNWTWNRLERKRAKRAPPQIEHLCRGLEQLLPLLQELHVKIGLENLPSWEAIPTEVELIEIVKRLGSESVGYWHDFGHGQIRENLGFVNHDRQLERLASHLVGFHVHDVDPPATDHLVPSYGKIDFERFGELVRRAEGLPLVIEPTRDAPAEALTAGVACLKKAWQAPPPASNGQAGFYS